VQAAQQSRPGETTAGICQVGLRNHGCGPMAAPALTENAVGQAFSNFRFRIHQNLSRVTRGWAPQHGQAPVSVQVALRRVRSGGEGSQGDDEIGAS
jgi:hypothetical protein